MSEALRVTHADVEWLLSLKIPGAVEAIAALERDDEIVITEMGK